MKGKSADLETRELAFRLYRECGGNKEMTLRRLAEAGYSISKPTLYDWIGKFNFDERVARADAKSQEAKDAALKIEDQILADLMRQKEKYEKYFESLGVKVDNQAQYAYTNLLTTMVNIRSKMSVDRPALFLDFLKDLVAYLSREDAGAVPVIEKNFDGIIEFAREKYGS